MKPLVVANWKMNPETLEKAKLLFGSIKKGTERVKGVEVAVCPPFVYLLSFRSQSPNLKLGAQDCFWEEKGAFTGEISLRMLKNLGCSYVIIGHSERRRYLKETEEMINQKIKAVLKEKLTPILCVENLFQAKKDLKGVSDKEFRNLILAYEPVFAIGTGKPCSIAKAKQMRNSLAGFSRVLYGGSVNSRNARDYIKKAGFQGLLIGGASLNPQEFIATVKTLI